MLFLAPDGICFPYDLVELVDMLLCYGCEDGAALAAADLTPAGVDMRQVKIPEVVKGLVLGDQHIIGKGEYLIGFLITEKGIEGRDCER